MDLSFNLVASKCADQMAKYQNCVVRNQMGDWASICRPEGRDLAACADQAVPHLAEMKAACYTQINTYTQCLESHASLPDEEIQKTCGELMKDLWRCSEKVMRDIEEKGSAGVAGVGGKMDSGGVGIGIGNATERVV